MVECYRRRVLVEAKNHVRTTAVKKSLYSSRTMLPQCPLVKSLINRVLRQKKVIRLLRENNSILKENNQLMNDIKDMSRKIAVNTS
jgi:hypothetical protein